jgi:hypothetical protein
MQTNPESRGFGDASLDAVERISSDRSTLTSRLCSCRLILVETSAASSLINGLNGSHRHHDKTQMFPDGFQRRLAVLAMAALFYSVELAKQN